MKIEAQSPEEYISKLQEERQIAITKIRETILKNIPDGFEEGMGYGMISYHVPHTLYPNGYHCNPKLPLPFINLASQKNFVALYHSGIYANENLYTWFVNEYPKHCKTKLDMGKSCIRFKKMNDIPFELIGKLTSKITTKEWITIYKKNMKKE